MAITSAQLTGAITASQTQFGYQNVSGTGFPAAGVFPMPPQPLLIDGEIMYIVTVPVAGTVQVRSRGAEGTAALPHDVLANIYTSPTPAADFGNPQPGTLTLLDPAEDLPVSIGQDGTINLIGANTIYNINKATPAALILPAPSLGDNGVAILFTSNTAAAHVITATGLLNDGTAGTPHNTATFASRVGASVQFIAENGFWNLGAGSVNVTIA